MSRVTESLSSKSVALITGASRSLGLGVAVARELGENGYHVIVTARNISHAEEQATMLRMEGYSAEGLRLDLTATGDFQYIAEYIRTQHGHLDVLINNASCMPDVHVHSALDVDIDFARTAFDINVVGVWALVKSMGQLLEAAPAARVVNITSGVYQQIAAGANFPEPVTAPGYSFSKYTLNVLTATLASAFRGTRVLVNAVDPGRVATHPEFADDEDRPASESAVWVAWAATLPAGGPTGGVFFDGERVA